jgi:proline iminopeptidase
MAQIGRRRVVWIAVVVAVFILAAAGAAAMRWMMQRPLFVPGTVAQRISARGESFEPPPAASRDRDVWQVTPAVALHHTSIGRGRDVVVAHGGPGMPPARPWKAAELTGDSVRWHFYDQRGSGRSTRPVTTPPAGGVWQAMQDVEGQLGLAAQLADIERIRRILGQERLVLVGHSFGALIVALYAAEWPERVETLILLAPAPLVTMPVEDGDLFALVRARLPQADRAEFDAYMSEYFDFPGLLKKDEATLARFFEKFGRFYGAAAGIGTQPDGAASDGELRAGGFVTLGLYLSLGRRHDWTSWLSRVRARVLVIHGTEDLQTRAATDRVARALPQAHVTDIAGAGHFMYDDRPEDVARLVRDALRVPAAASVPRGR